MLGRIWDWIKAHPMWTAGIVLGIIVLFWLMRSGGSSSSGLTDEGAVASARIGAASQEAINYQQTQAAVALGAQQVELGKAAITAQQDVLNRQTTAAVDTSKVQAAMLESLANYQYKTSLGEQATSISLANIQADVTKLGITTALETEKVKAQTTYAQTWAGLQGANFKSFYEALAKIAVVNPNYSVPSYKLPTLPPLDLTKFKM